MKQILCVRITISVSQLSYDGELRLFFSIKQAPIIDHYQDLPSGCSQSFRQTDCFVIRKKHLTIIKRSNDALKKFYRHLYNSLAISSFHRI
jgi:hypothetical protein